jgi:hypothetical protein
LVVVGDVEIAFSFVGSDILRKKGGLVGPGGDWASAGGDVEGLPRVLRVPLWGAPKVIGRSGVVVAGVGVIELVVGEGGGGVPRDVEGSWSGKLVMVVGRPLVCAEAVEVGCIDLTLFNGHKLLRLLCLLGFVFFEGGVLSDGGVLLYRIFIVLHLLSFVDIWVVHLKPSGFAPFGFVDLLGGRAAHGFLVLLLGGEDLEHEEPVAKYQCLLGLAHFIIKLFSDV